MAGAALTCRGCQAPLEDVVNVLVMLTKQRGRLLLREPSHSLRLCVACFRRLGFDQLIGADTRRGD